MSDTIEKSVAEAPKKEEVTKSAESNEVDSSSEPTSVSKTEASEKKPELPPKPSAEVNANVNLKESNSEEKIDDIPLGNAEDEEAPPPRPPRPLSPLAQAKKTLKDAFPQIDEKYVTAVLIASQGVLDPAFNALLYISDPSFEPEIPIGKPEVPAKKRTQLEDDELLARKLAREFELQERRNQPQPRRPDDRRRRQQRASVPIDDDEESEDEFEQIRKNFNQGVEEAKTKLNSWVSGIAKKFQDPSDSSSSNQNKLFGALGGFSDRSSIDSNNASQSAGADYNDSTSNANNKSGQRFTYNRTRSAHFDEDPEVISHDFSAIKLSNNDAAPIETKSILKKRDTDDYGVPKASKPKDKWQPLAAASIEPVSSDTFLVTSDSDEEDVSKKTTDAKNL